MKMIGKILSCFLVLTLAVLFLTSCDDDSNDDLSEVQALLIDGEWKLTSLEYEHSDATIETLIQTYLGMVEVSMDFHADGELLGTSVVMGMEDVQTMEWELASGDETLFIDDAELTIVSISSSELILQDQSGVIIDMSEYVDADLGASTVSFTKE